MFNGLLQSKTLAGASPRQKQSHRCSLGVVLPLLDVILPQNFDLVKVVVHLPVDEVHLL